VIVGDIHWVQLPAANGREQRGRRPVEALKAALYQQIGPLKVELD
jgi:mRNA-degrading endonuclease toxin of MazEF toxin-antitoxin module